MSSCRTIAEDYCRFGQAMIVYKLLAQWFLVYRYCEGRNGTALQLKVISDLFLFFADYCQIVRSLRGQFVRRQHWHANKAFARLLTAGAGAGARVCGS